MKVTGRLTYIAAYASSVALCILDRAGIYLRPQLKLALKDFGLK